MMGQRCALSEAEKQYLQRRKEEGASLAQIAQELSCSPETTRKWWRWLRKEKRPNGRGRPKRGNLSTYPETLREKVVVLKKKHPHWGPVSIKLELQHDVQWEQSPLPSNARLSMLFRQACPEAVQPREHYLTRVQNLTVHHPHQRWQMDAKEGVRVGQEWVTIQEIRDVYSGLMVQQVAFVTTTPKRWRHLTLAEHQHTLRLAFQQWGMPLEVQTDHDGVFITPGQPQFPSLFSLWLLGLGIQHVTSRPYRPTDQGAIERNHRTLADFSWKDQTFTELSELQHILDLHQHRYNTEYPSRAAHCEGQPPLLRFPYAHSSGRLYHPAQEWDTFSLGRVDAFVASLIWSRPVVVNGVVCLGGEYYYLGRNLIGQQVSIQFFQPTRSFRFLSAEGTLIREWPVKHLDKQDILGFLPADLALPVGYQFPLPFIGV
jgi:transposase InsO family protein